MEMWKCALTTILLSVAASAASFDASLTRNRLFPLSAAAYSTYPDQCVATYYQNATVTKTVNADCGEGKLEFAVCYGFTGVSHSDKAVFLAYRGTTEAFQLVYESYRTVLVDMVDSPVGGKVSSYFHGVYTNLRNGGLDAEFKALAAKYPSYELWITGHSLGGALAAIAAGELVARDNVNQNRIKLITFGQPREGNAVYASRFNLYVPYSKRVVNRKDIVPHVPPRDLFDYYHHSEEVWYPDGTGSNAAYKECARGEDDSCSNSIGVVYSVSDHVVYYDNFIVGYGYTGCRGIDSILDLIKNLG